MRTAGMVTLDDLDAPPRHRAAPLIAALLIATSLTTAALATLAAAAARDDERLLTLTDDPCAHVVATGGRAAITWSTTPASDTNHIMMGVDETYGRVLTATPGTTHSVTVDALTPGATYHFRTQSTRSATGAMVQSGDCMFPMPGVDRTPPRMTSLVQLSSSSDPLRIGFTTNEPTIAWIDSAHPDGASWAATPTITHELTVARPPSSQVLPALSVADRAGNVTTFPLAFE
ncbi:hypothetical protein HY632_02075 [Candidatus Uhrbacteria bacterium]|nr:hypothetical protein [Candidatus Uhrbacteria bacterium]